MNHFPFSCAALCHGPALRAIVIAGALAGCGGIATSSADRSPSDASPPPPTGCPSYHDIDVRAAEGKACAPEGTYCLDPACDPCTMNCPAVACTRGTWTPAVNTALCTGTQDASVDTGACIVLDPATFDQTCKQDSDCLAATGGTFCSNAPWCMCPGATINVDGQSRYDAILQEIQSNLKPGPGGCSCPFFGTPRCVAKLCTLCGGAAGNSPGCPDGG